jgi:hypothetical protein
MSDNEQPKKSSTELADDIKESVKKMAKLSEEASLKALNDVLGPELAVTDGSEGKTFINKLTGKEPTEIERVAAEYFAREEALAYIRYAALERLPKERIQKDAHKIGVDSYKAFMVSCDLPHFVKEFEREMNDPEYLSRRRMERVSDYKKRDKRIIHPSIITTNYTLGRK